MKRFLMRGPHGPKWWRRVLSRADVVVARLGPKDAALLMNALAREHYVDAMSRQPPAERTMRRVWSSLIS